eukprot:s1557_g13.t2
MFNVSLVRTSLDSSAPRQSRFSPTAYVHIPFHSTLKLEAAQQEHESGTLMQFSTDTICNQALVNASVDGPLTASCRLKTEKLDAVTVPNGPSEGMDAKYSWPNTGHTAYLRLGETAVWRQCRLQSNRHWGLPCRTWLTKSGVEVYEREWSYGGGMNGPSGSGVFCCRPRGCDAHSYREAVPMGKTTMSRSAVEALIKDLAKKWKGAEYDLLRHNCCHFSDALCLALGVGHVPGWVTSLAGVGAMLRTGQRQRLVVLVLTAELVGAAAVPQLAVQGFTAVAELLAGPDTEESEGHLGNPKPLEDRSPAAEARRPDPMRCHVEGELQDAARYGGYKAAGETDRRLSAANSDGTPSPTSPALTSPPSATRLESHAKLAVGDAVEVFSNSRQLWCSGEVKSLDLQGSPPAVEVVFWIPGSPDVALGSKEIVPAVAPDCASKRPSETAGSPTWSVGDCVEVFSNSKSSWCSGRITQVSSDKVKVVYQSPGASEDDWLEKELLMGSDALRKVASEVELPEVSPKRKVALSEAEESAYKVAFSQLRPKKQTPQVLDANVLAEYLKTSKLPRKVLKEIWKASVRSSTQADFDEFGACCRLVAHCQKAIKEHDQATIEVMEQAGTQLRQLVVEKFMEQAPTTLPDFYGGPVGSGH